MAADYAWATELSHAGRDGGSWTASLERLHVPVESNGSILGVTNQLSTEPIGEARARLTEWSLRSSWVCGCSGRDACADAAQRGYARIACQDGQCEIVVITGASAVETCEAERDGVAQERSDDEPGCVFPSGMPELARCGGQSAYVDGRTIVLARSPECLVLGSIAWRGAGGDRVADMQGEALLRALRSVLPRIR